MLPQDKQEIEEVKGTTLEEVDTAAKKGNVGLLEKIINRAAAKIREIEDAAHERAWLSTPEGKAWKKRQADEAKLDAVHLKQAEEVYAARVLEAKRALALERFADELLKTAKIDDNDPHLAQIMYNQSKMREVIAAAFLRR